jgi:solute carrier family 25 (mitochondrial oxoglutarate transporter), member 11
VCNIDAEGVLPYKNFVDCFAKSVKNEGFLNLWVGLPTYYFRVAPHAMISILVQDYLHDIINKKKKE